MSTGELDGHSRFARRERAASCDSGMDARVGGYFAVVGAVDRPIPARLATAADAPMELGNACNSMACRT